MKLRITLLPLFSLLTIALTFSPNNTKTKLDKNIAKCHYTTQSFAELGDEPSFRAIHEDPKAFTSFQPSGEMITYDVPGGKSANAYIVKSGLPTKDYLFVIHEWYGLNDYVKSESDKFAKTYDQMNVIALDLYDGQVASNSEDARKYMQSVETERALAIINAAQAYVGEDANIYTVGWCFGGGWSLQSAIELGDQAKAAVMFYGMPEQDLERLEKLKCDVLAIFAEKDRWITPTEAGKFESNMSSLDNQLVLKSYNADHGFANPSNPNFDQESATAAYKEMFAFIGERR
ncbi:MAG: dienelactone hydrolase family protein [Marinoscillum sp.]